MGQNFKEHIDQLRIQKSIQLLRDSEETLEAISQQVGYTNTSSFIRSFKKWWARRLGNIEIRIKLKSKDR